MFFLCHNLFAMFLVFACLFLRCIIRLDGSCMVFCLFFNGNVFMCLSPLDLLACEIFLMLNWTSPIACIVVRDHVADLWVYKACQQCHVSDSTVARPKLKLVIVNMWWTANLYKNFILHLSLSISFLLSFLLYRLRFNCFFHMLFLFYFNIILLVICIMVSTSL